MKPDEFQEAWRAETAQARVSIDVPPLLQALDRSHHLFQTMIWWRDFREVLVALAMLPFWLYTGIAGGQPWSWYLAVPAALWVVGFIVADRIRHKPTPEPAGESLLSAARVSLGEVEHQIWLLRNVAWWYLMPFTMALLTYFAHVSWLRSGNWLEATSSAAGPSAFVLALYYAIYYMNQRAVRKQLAPQRAELLHLIENLEGDGAVESECAYPMLLEQHGVPCSRRRIILANLTVLAVLFAVVPAIVYLGSTLDRYLNEDFPKLAPFTEVRWGREQPIVTIAGDQHLLFSIDGIAIGGIVDFCKHAYPAKWQKRFSEDLVEVLSRMGQPPGDTVRLELLRIDPPGERTTLEVAMTAANRRAVRKANEEREADREELDAMKKEAIGREAEDPVDADPFAAKLEAIRASYKLPAMAAFALRGGVIIERATAGTRSLADDTPAGPDAPWHIGSNTKAMTATVAGMLVEKKLLRWDSTIGEVLGSAAPEMDAGHRDTTLAMLLNHTGGVVPNINWFAAPEDRVACAAALLANPPSKKGAFAYSNGGYVVAGAMMEAVTGMRWEDLMRERLFDPLGMKNTGFGAPTGPNAPWGHESGVFRWKPKDPASGTSDNAPVLGPAGTVHTTLEDYARFIAAHLKGARGQGGIVSDETFARLHTPPEGGEYALGWIVTDREWAGGRALTHGGSNTLWFATVWIAPERDLAFFAVTNAGGNTAFKAVDEAVVALLERHGSRE